MKIGSLCSGYGGLDMAVEAFYDAETIWMSDIDKASSLVIEQRWQLPNLGDLKNVDWETVEPIDILTAGYPCQPFSSAGQRKGTNDPRHLWPSIKEIISRIRPGIVILENVRGHLTLGFKEVLQGLTEIGYDARWEIVRASDVGAPHRRERLFILAQPTNSNGFRCSLGGKQSGTQRNQGQSQFESNDLGKSIITYSNSSANQQLRRADREVYGEGSQIINGSDRQKSWFSGEVIRDTDRQGTNPITQVQKGQSNSERICGTITSDAEYTGRFRTMQESSRRFNSLSEMSMQRTPNPLDQSKLNPKFVEYMMGLPEGWVTDLHLSRAQQFKLLGNGVVPQQAFRALEILNTI